MGALEDREEGRMMPPGQSERAADPTPAVLVTIRRAVEADATVVYVVSDEDSEFARSTTIADALHYASDLLHGPGTGPRGTVWGYNPQPTIRDFDLDEELESVEDRENDEWAERVRRDGSV
jgi:hypothetical protein